MNVVGASSPEPVAVRAAAAFGEILHTPAVARARGQVGGAVLRRRVRSGDGRAGVALHAAGLGLRARATASRHSGKLPLERRSRTGCCRRSSRRRRLRAGSTTTPRSRTDAGRARRCPRPGPRRRSTSGRSTTGRRSTSVAARFGSSRAPSSVLARASDGAEATRAIGLDSGREQSRIGPSAFDVAPDGSVVVLDQVNHRLVRLRQRRLEPAHMPIDFAGGEGDLAVDGDGVDLRARGRRASRGSRVHGRGGADRGDAARRAGRPT